MESVHIKATASRTSVCELENGEGYGLRLRERKALFNKNNKSPRLLFVQQSCISQAQYSRYFKWNIFNTWEQGSGPLASYSLTETKDVFLVSPQSVHSVLGTVVTQ